MSEPADTERFRVLPEPIRLADTIASQPTGVAPGLPTGVDWERDIVVPMAGG